MIAVAWIRLHSPSGKRLSERLFDRGSRPEAERGTPDPEQGADPGDLSSRDSGADPAIRSQRQSQRVLFTSQLSTELEPLQKLNETPIYPKLLKSVAFLMQKLLLEQFS